MEIFERVLEPGHIYISYPLHSLATIYRDQQRTGEAESFYRRALAIQERALEPDDPDLEKTRRDFVILLRTMNREAEARQLEKKIEAASRSE